jgi:hypothetical protein
VPEETGGDHFIRRLDVVDGSVVAVGDDLTLLKRRF